MTDESAITDAELAELERLAAAATPGPWLAMFDGENGWTFAVFTGKTSEVEGPLPYERADMVFAAEARTAVPRLIAEVRRLRELVKAYQDLEKLGGGR